jgi:ribosomal protein L16/L10AE
MLLQPRKFKYKTRQKSRSVVMAREALLAYGDSGVRLLQPLRLTGRRIFRLKIFLKKAARKPDITKRRVWFNAFPHTPLTKKGKGLRMGKGIGKLSA